jgi:hypothetical protein
MSKVNLGHSARRHFDASKRPLKVVESFLEGAEKAQSKAAKSRTASHHPLEEMSSRPTVYITFEFGWGACVFGFCVGMIQPLGRQTSDTSTTRPDPVELCFTSLRLWSLLHS